MKTRFHKKVTVLQMVRTKANPGEVMESVYVTRKYVGRFETDDMNMENLLESIGGKERKGHERILC